MPRNSALYLSENVYNLCSSDDEEYEQEKQDKGFIQSKYNLESKIDLQD